MNKVWKTKDVSRGLNPVDTGSMLNFAWVPEPAIQLKRRNVLVSEKVCFKNLAISKTVGLIIACQKKVEETRGTITLFVSDPPTQSQ
jgi:hypothetical protein